MTYFSATWIEGSTSALIFIYTKKLWIGIKVTLHLAIYFCGASIAQD
jgi:hypothetical protein